MHGIRERGGIATYIHRIAEMQTSTEHTVYYLDSLTPIATQYQLEDNLIQIKDSRDLFVQAKALRLNILHLHTAINTLPNNHIPVIRTVHDNNPSCPSGSKYLKRWSKPCDRPYRLSGCLWGHLIDHCGSVRPNKLQGNFQRTWLEMKTLKQIPMIANSQFVKNQMLRSGYDEENLQVLLLPAPEIREYIPPPEKEVPRFLFLGRIAPEKGWEWLLRSLATIKVPINLDIAGAGNEQQNLAIRQTVTHLGLENKVKFHGWVKEDRINQLLKQSRAVVFPSLWQEPAGLVSLEAAAAGRAVIASNVGGIPEYVGPLQNALLVEPNDVQGLAKRIELLATDWALAKNLGVKGRTLAQESFSLSQHIQELMQLYQATQESKLSA